MESSTKTKRPIGGTHTSLTDEQGKELDRRAFVLSGNLFTPRLRNGRRIGVVLDDASYSQVRGRGLGNRGVVTDLSTGNQYEIVGARCGLAGCICDAVAIRKAEKFLQPK
jgi:hypothetical protein